MNDTRLKAVEARAHISKAPIMRCWLSDGTVKDMHILEALKFGRGCDQDFNIYEPYILKAECIVGEQTAPKLVSVLLQLVEHNYKKAQRGEIHHD